MQHVLQTGKRALSVAVAAATIMFSAGASLLAPSVAAAASAGDLIKGTSLSTVYYYGYDGMRYTFPNEKTFMTWFADFDDVTTISDSALADISLAGNVVYRPGSYWIKIQSDPKTYAVSTDGTIRWIESEDVAVDFAGSNWASSIQDVSDVFFTDYTVGTSLMAAEAFDGMLYKDGSDYYIAWNGEMRSVSSAGRSANNLQAGFFLDGSGIDDSALTAGDAITGEVASLVDVAQTVTDESVATGNLTLSLASSNPASATIPLSSTGVEMLSFNAKAGSEDASLDLVTFTMSGLSTSTDVGNVYLYEGVTRLTDARTVNSASRQVTFGSLGLSIEAGDTRTFTLRADEGSAAVGDIISFSIASADNVTGSGSVGGSFPISGNDFTLANVTAGTLTVSEYGTISNPTIGQSDAVIGKFKLAAATEDASVEAITLKVDNSSDHSDFKLWVDGVVVASGTDIGDKLVSFDLSSDPIVILDGHNEVFELSAKIGGEDLDDVKVYVENSVDVISVGGDYGFGMAITISDYDGDNSCTSTADECSFSDVQGGDITFTLVGPAAGDVLVDSQDQTLLAFTLSSAQDVTVKDLDIIVYADDDGDNDAMDAVDDDAANANGDADGLVNTSTEANITDIKIVNADTGAVIMGPLELDALTDASSADDADQTIDFTDDFELSAGTTLNLVVTVDVDDSITAATELGATLVISGFVANDSNDDAVTNIVPSANLAGYNQEANASTITFALASSPVSQTAVQGKQGVDVVGISVTASDASDVTVSALTFQGYADDTNTSAMTAGGAATFQLEDLVTSCSLYDNAGNLLDGPEGLTTAGVLTFNEMDWTVAAGGVELLSLECDLANPSDTDDEVIAFEIASDTGATTSTNVTAVDEDGDDATVTITKAGADGVGFNDSSNDAPFDATVGVTITASGTIAVAASSGTPSADFLMTGSSNTHVGEFTFTATNENFLVDKVEIEEVAAGEFGDTASAYANNISLVTITYPTEDGTTDSASAIMTSSTAIFSGLTMFVDSDSRAQLDVYVDVPVSARNAGGSATSNERIEIAVSSDSGDFNAVGVDSGVADTQASGSDVDTDVVFVVRESKPTITLSSSSPSGASTPGDFEVYRFNIAASSNEDVVFTELIWQLRTSDNNGELADGSGADWNECDNNETGDTVAADFDIYNLSEQGTSVALDTDAMWAFYGTDGSACSNSQQDIGFVHLTLTTGEIVPAGETYSYALYFDSTGANAANDDTLQFELGSDPVGGIAYVDTSNLAVAVTSATGTTISITDGDVSTNSYTAGDVICLNDANDGTCGASEEIAFVTAVDGSVNPDTLTVVRGYLGRTPDAAVTNGDNVLRLRSAFVWEDDGSTGSAATGEDWGAYLVDSLPVAGGRFSF